MRAIKRAGLPVAYSEGYHPLPRLAPGPPLPLGIESEAEYMDMICTDPLKEEEIRNRLQVTLPPGLEVLMVRKISSDLKRTPSLSAAINLLSYSWILTPVPGWTEEDVRLIFAELWKKKELPVTRERKGQAKIIDIRSLWKGYELLAEGDNSYQIRIETVFGPQGTIRPDDFDQYLPKGFKKGRIIRTGAWIVTEDCRKAPIPG